MFQAIFFSLLFSTIFWGSEGLRIKRADRIIGGRPIDIAEAPYQVQILINSQFFCGGVILGPNVIVTAAHCVKDSRATNLVIMAGTTYLAAGGSNYTVSSFIYHPKFTHRTFDYDVALIFLKNDIEFDTTRRAISISEVEPRGGQTVRSTGWGQTQAGWGAPSVHLLAVDLPVVDWATCAEDYDTLYTVTPRMFCAGEKGKSPCHGDSGGPVTVNGTLVGLTSWAQPPACSLPAVNTNLVDPELRAWIKEFSGI